MQSSEARSPERFDAAWVCRRYEEIRDRLPRVQFAAARFADPPRRIPNLSPLIGEIDVFVLDGYGVLNIGRHGVPGAPERVAEFRAAGKQVIVLTNGASHPKAHAVERYRGLGFDFTADEIVSSRDALARGMAGRLNLKWGFAAIEASGFRELARNSVRLGDDPATYETVDGFALLGTGDWSRARHELMLASLERHPRPVLVGNPDLVSPREDGLAAEPGLYAHEIADRTGCAPEFYGKPFANAFEIVAEQIGPDVPPNRIAMVGDTLQTDILGGAGMGWRTVLVMGHGLLRGFDPGALHELSDIRPDWIAETT